MILFLSCILWTNGSNQMKIVIKGKRENKRKKREKNENGRDKNTYKIRIKLKKNYKNRT